MSQYKEGTVSTEIGTNVVTGVNTAWLIHVRIGDEIKIGTDTVFYQISGIASNTSLTISANYPSTKVTQNYIINSDFTANLGLPLVGQGDAYFADTYSRAMRMVDAAVSFGLIFIGSVLDKDLAAAPGAPSDGDAYIVASPVGGGDDWFGYEDYIATWDATSSTWGFLVPIQGYLVFVADENALYIYTGSEWIVWNVSVGNPYYDQTIAEAALDSSNLIVVTHNLGKQLIHCTAMDTNDIEVGLGVTFTSTVQATLDCTGVPSADFPLTVHFS
ncbi:MAG TPA: DUF2793 domain-containing protein, partial [Sedimentisphaerales bacterium]|nr:DUF2793 domain-containing protein [Sedimentisphaerales bacterium]